MLTQSIHFLVVISLHLALPFFDSLFQLSVSIILCCPAFASFPFLSPSLSSVHISNQNIIPTHRFVEKID